MEKKDRDKWKLINKFKDSLIPPCEVCRMRLNESYAERAKKHGRVAVLLYQSCDRQKECKEFLEFHEKFKEIENHCLEYGVFIRS